MVWGVDLAAGVNLQVYTAALFSVGNFAPENKSHANFGFYV